eukprot:scaffold1844_cov403-Pavlova_lutheri.AAC.1
MDHPETVKRPRRHRSTRGGVFHLASPKPWSHPQGIRPGYKLASFFLCGINHRPFHSNQTSRSKYTLLNKRCRGTRIPARVFEIFA